VTLRCPFLVKRDREKFPCNVRLIKAARTGTNASGAQASSQKAYQKSLKTARLVRPQSSSTSHFTAGAFGFLTFNQCGERPSVSGEGRGAGAGDLRLQTAMRLGHPLQRIALLPRLPCGRQLFGNCPVRVDSRFCRAHPYTDKSRHCGSRNMLEVRKGLGRPFERRSPTLASNRS
jgi:hypothetical protein